MAQKESLTSSALKQYLAEARQEGSPVIASYITEGKWRLFELKICGFSDDFIAFYTQADYPNLKNDQPVGICIHLGYYKYLFNSTVLAVESHGQLWKVLLEFPEKSERIERRLFHRHPVPENMNIKVLFWHRGYLDDTNKQPKEQYWQGKLLNLSAAGAQIEIASDQHQHFCIGQLLGIQFTPMSYEKPLLLDSHVRYLKTPSNSICVKIGVEFLGLEATDTGKETLNRILEVLQQYEQLNTEAQKVQA